MTSPDPALPTPHATLTVRPRRITIYAAVGGALVIALMIYVALQLRTSDTGVYFRSADAIAMVGLGVLFAGGLLLLGRPRLRVDASGVRVRNILGERFFPWPLVQRIAFPAGAVWASLELADDETVSVMAIQAMDKGRSVTALKQVRALHEKYAPPASVVPPERAYRAPDPARPLGRLEKIDLQKAAEGKRKGTR